ncbi:MAG: VWA domain-containing protein, partial [Fimbriiglobus sp.]
MTDRTARRAAWAISGLLHAGAAVGVWAFFPPPAPPDREPPFALTLVEPTEPTEPDDPPAVDVTAPPPNPTGRPPVVSRVPPPLSREIQAFVRDRGDRPAAPDAVLDVVTVRATTPPTTPGSTVEPAGYQPPVLGPPAARTPPLHGEFAAGKTVVYVLDCSGTMGLGGRLGRACDAIRATLETQPSGVRVMVVAYSGTAAAVLPGGPVAVTPEAREQFAAALARLDPAGASRHAEGLRVALKCDPDAVLVLTDAGTDELADLLRPLIRGAGRPVGVAV